MQAGLDEREYRIAQQREVLRPAGLASRAAVFAPHRGVFAPVVFVFHRPVPATDLGEPDMAGIAFAQRGQEVAGLGLEVSGALLLAVVPGDAHQLPRSREQGDIKVPFGDPQFAPFDAPVGGLDPGCPRGGTRVKLVPGNLTQRGLVVLEGNKDIRPGGGGDQRRFFGSAGRRR